MATGKLISDSMWASPECRWQAPQTSAREHGSAITHLKETDKHITPTERGTKATALSKSIPINRTVSMFIKVLQGTLGSPKVCRDIIWKAVLFSQKEKHLYQKIWLSYVWLQWKAYQWKTWQVHQRQTKAIPCIAYCFNSCFQWLGTAFSQSMAGHWVCKERGMFKATWFLWKFLPNLTHNKI